MMAADYRHIGGVENRLGRHYSRFSPFWPAASFADQSLALRKSWNAGSNRRSQVSRGDANLGARQCRQYDIGLASDRAFRLVDDGDDLLALALGITQSRQGVRGLARLRYKNRGTTFRHRRLPVAELRGDVDLDRNPCDMLEPVFGDDAGVMGRPAGNHSHPFELAERKGQFWQIHGAGRRIDQRIERIADDCGLFEDLLLHEMAVNALANQ